MSPLTKDEAVRLGATVVVGGVLAGCMTYFKLKQQEKFWLLHDRKWRELFDSAMRINDILQDDSLSEEEKAEATQIEMNFIKLTRGFVED